MTCKKICFPQEYYDHVLEELGRVENGAEMIDNNSDVMESRKEFFQPINRCKEIEKKILKIEKICEEFNFEIKRYDNIKSFHADCQEDKEFYKKHSSPYFDIIENQIYEDEKKLDEFIQAKNHLIQEITEKHEMFYAFKNLVNSLDVLSANNRKISGAGSKVFASDYSIGEESYLSAQLLEEGHYEDNQLYICGVVRAEEKMKYQRMIFRASFDRCNFKFLDIPDVRQKYIMDMEVNKGRNKSEFNKSAGKKAFIIFVEDIAFKKKIAKISSVMDVKLYEVPALNKVKETMSSIKNDIIQASKLLKQTNISILDLLSTRIGEGDKYSKYAMYKLFVKKEKFKLTALNKCTHLGNLYEARVCIPEKKLDQITKVLRENSENNHYSILIEDMSVPDGFVYPTYFELNDFTFPFQEIVNTYGFPRYQEINPSLFNIVTFPFLFGVMFGDIGHGLLLFLFGSYLVLNNEKINRGNNALMKGFSKARYLLFLMGLFAFYCGWMYNDFLSIPLDLFGSCYTNDETGDKAYRLDKTCVYPFGLDPKWFVASNELAFFNSLKMKLSVIFGVIHMLFGIVLRGVNALYFNSKLDFICEFIPQIIFMSLLFGYMIIMIFIKWATDWTENLANSPSIITTLMNIFLNLGSVDGKPLFYLENPSFQENLQFYFLLISLICLPILLFPKPIITYLQHSKANKHHAHGGYHKIGTENEHAHTHDSHEDHDAIIINNNHKRLINEDGEGYEKYEAENYIELQDFKKAGKSDKKIKEDAHVAGSSEHKKEEEHGFGDLFVHQSIETIEFTLGSISNTASYLRLWALSLAHAQLAKVFFDKALLGFIHQGSLILVIIGFFIFANVTFFVLMCMDLMECFLHTLRLHWVEFQNKFFKADGRKFNPYDFSTLLEL